MDFFVWQRTIVDESGNVLPSASVSVTDVVSGSLATLYSDEGVTGIGNPITADSNGFAQFYVKSGRYDIVATLAANSRTWNDEAIGAPYKRTADEVSAGVTPTNYQYPPGHAYRYGTNMSPGTTDMRSAIQAAINQSVQTGGAPAIIPPESLAVASALTPVTGMTIRGEDRYKSKIVATANTFSIFDDGATARTDLTFENLILDGGSIGSSNRGILLDTDTANMSERIKIKNVKFQNLYRGAEIDRVDDLEFDNNTHGDLDSSILYVGESVAKGRSTNIKVRHIHCKDGDIVDASGGGNIVIAYADGVVVNDVTLEDTGASSGASNLFHGVYLRSCTDGEVDGVRANGHRRGAAVHVFADTGSGESRGRDIQIRGVIASGQTAYAAVRCDQVDGLTLSDIQGYNGHTQVAYITNVTGLVTDGLQGKNNNQEGITGVGNAMVRLENILGGEIKATVSIDDDAGSGEYGQGAVFRIDGDNEDLNFNGVTMRFDVAAAGAIGYYVFNVVTGATWDGGNIANVIQRGASSLFDDTDEAAVGLTFTNINQSDIGGSAPLTNAQMHKFAARNLLLDSVPFGRESDGKYIIARVSASPGGGSETWVQGDIAWRTTPSAGFAPGYVCTVSGTPGTWKEMGDLDA